MPSYSRSPIPTLITDANTILSFLAQGDDPFGFAASQLARLNTASLSEAAGALATARAVATAAVRAQAAARERLAAALSSAAATAYASTATDVQLASIGLPPRRGTSPRPQAATAVTNLVATPAVDGLVRLTWDRGANAYSSTTFLIETSADGVAWSFASTTKKASAALSGFAPGMPAWFRVTAATSTSTSLPSARVSIYAPATPAVQLRVAA